MRLRRDGSALADLIGTVLASLRNHDGNGVQRVKEGSPAKWYWRSIKAGSGEGESGPLTPTGTASPSGTARQMLFQR
jgi:hypothetical protein